MLYDKNLIFTGYPGAMEQVITATANSVHTINLADVGIGDDEILNLLLEVTEAFAAAGAATLQVDAETDDNAAFTSPVVLQSTGVIGKAALVAGYRIPLSIPTQGREEHLRLVFTVATGPMTAGKVVGGLVISPQTNGAPIAVALSDHGY